MKLFNHFSRGCTADKRGPPSAALPAIGCGLSALTLHSITLAQTGDLIHFEVRASWDPAFDVQVELPALPVDKLPLVDAVLGEPMLEDGRYEQVWSYRLRADRVGVYSLPAVHARYSPVAASPLMSSCG